MFSAFPLIAGCGLAWFDATDRERPQSKAEGRAAKPKRQSSPRTAALVRVEDRAAWGSGARKGGLVVADCYVRVPPEPRPLGLASYACGSADYVAWTATSPRTPINGVSTLSRSTPGDSHLGQHSFAVQARLKRAWGWSKLAGIPAVGLTPRTTPPVSTSGTDRWKLSFVKIHRRGPELEPSQCLPRGPDP